MCRYTRHHRGLAKQDYRRVLRKNTRRRIGCLLVMSRENHMDISRLGMAISRKHLARAVDRNRIKRLVRESFRLHQPFTSPSDVVVMSCPGLASRTNSQVMDALEQSWRALSLSGH